MAFEFTLGSENSQGVKLNYILLYCVQHQVFWLSICGFF